MLACIACSKRISVDCNVHDDEDGTPRSPASKEAIKSLTSQIRDMALKFPGARNSRPGTPTGIGRALRGSRFFDSEPCSPCGGSSTTTPSWKNTVLMLEDEDEGKEWTSMVEPGILITLVSAKGGYNDLKRIRFSRELFNKWQAQQWWAENSEKIMELYNIKAQIKEESQPPNSAQEKKSVLEKMPKGEKSDSESIVTPSNSSISQTQTEDLSSKMSTSEERSDGFLSAYNSSGGNIEEEEVEWIEEDEPGVYITIYCSPQGKREIKRVRFSREMFNEMQAKRWWERNRDRIHDIYLMGFPGI